MRVCTSGLPSCRACNKSHENSQCRDSEHKIWHQTPRPQLSTASSKARQKITNQSLSIGSICHQHGCCLQSFLESYPYQGAWGHWRVWPWLPGHKTHANHIPWSWISPYLGPLGQRWASNCSLTSGRRTHVVLSTSVPQVASWSMRTTWKPRCRCQST